MTLRIPGRLAWVAEHWARDDVRAWLAGLPSRVNELAESWAIDVDDPYEPGGYTAWVAPARMEDGTDCVLKVLIPFEGHMREADALRMWDGVGAVRVLRGERFELLLERCDPGVPLSTLDVAAADAVAVSVLQRLWREHAPDGPWNTVAELGPRIASGIRHDASRHSVPFDRRIAMHAAEFADGAASSDAARVFLHGDFHHNNVLSAKREPWLAIDPGPKVGDPAFDAAFLMVDRAEDVLAHADPQEVVAQRLTAIADGLSLDRRQLAEWALVRCVSLALNALQDGWSFGVKRIELVPLLASELQI